MLLVEWMLLLAKLLLLVGSCFCWLASESEAACCNQLPVLLRLCFRYVNEDPKRQSSHNHYANLNVDVKAVMMLVDAMLRVQQAAMRRYSFDAH